MNSRRAIATFDRRQFLIGAAGSLLTTSFVRRGPCGARDPGRCRKLQLHPRRRHERNADRVEPPTSRRTVHPSHDGRRARLLRRHREYCGATRTSVSRRQGDRLRSRGERCRNGSDAGGPHAARRDGDVARRRPAPVPVSWVAKSATSPLTASGLLQRVTQVTPDFQRCHRANAFGPLTAARSQTGPLFAHSGRLEST